MLGFCGLIGHKVLIGTDLLEYMMFRQIGILNRIMKNGVLNRIMKKGVSNRIMKNININKSKTKQVPLLTVSDRLVHWISQIW